MVTLKSGWTLIELDYGNNSDSMGAEAFIAEKQGDHLVVQFTVKPSGSNQAGDEENLHVHDLVAVIIDDDNLIEQLSEYLREKTVSSMELRIHSKGRCLTFDVSPGGAAMDRLSLLVKKRDG